MDDFVNSRAWWVGGGEFEATKISLKADEWASGDINWLIDVIAPDQKTTASVLGNFKQVVKEGDLRMHPIIARLVDKETLEKMGASSSNGTANKNEKG